MIRLATPADIKQLLMLCKTANASAPNYQLKLDIDKVRGTLLQAMADKKMCLFVAERDGDLTGLLLGGVESLWCSNDEYATDLMFYVRPNSGLAGRGLLKAFDGWWRKFPKCREASLAISSGQHIEQVSRLYHAHGFKNQGGVFTKFRSQP